MNRKKYNWKLPSKIEKRIGKSTYGKQRTILEDDQLLIILHDIPQKKQLTREAKIFWRKPDGEFLCDGKSDGQNSLKQLLSRYEKKLASLEDLYHKATKSVDYFALIEELTPINRAATHLYNTLQSARELIKEDEFIIEMRDQAYELQRNFELLLSDAKLALDCNIAKNSEAQVSKSDEVLNAQHRLNIIAAIFFPLMAIAAIFGMNLLHGFENKNPVFFWIVFVAGLSAGIFFKNWIIKYNNRKP